MANTKEVIIRTFEFKLRTNKSFVEVCERELEHSRQIYNAALAERISCYQITGASLGYVEQSRHLTEARTLPEVKAICGRSNRMRSNALTKLLKVSFDVSRMERSRAFPDSRAKTAITLTLKNTRRSGLARSKATNLRFPASVAVESGFPARLKDNVNSF